MEFAKKYIETTKKILISPTPATFFKEAVKGDNNFSGIFVCLVLFAIYYSVFISIAIGNLLTALVTSISMSIFIPTTVILAVSVANFIYHRVFRRKNYIYDKLLYLTTAIIISIQLIALPLFLLLPEALKDYSTYITWFYQLMLIIIAFKAISELNYLQSFITIILSIFAGLLLWICMAPFLLSMMGGVNSVF